MYGAGSGRWGDREIGRWGGGEKDFIPLPIHPYTLLSSQRS